MDHKIGAVGLGHWFNRLNVGMQMTGGISLAKAVGTRPYDEKVDIMSNFKISRNDYYTTDAHGHIPDQFFHGIDVVHISDPNRLHALQTKQSLLKDKYVVTEKSFATTKSEFRSISSFIRKGNYWNKAYLHLHYLHKQPTLILKAILPGLVKKHGRIKSVSATFFEKENEEDVRRRWLFAPENGGIFMDWIHPFEILHYATESRFDGIKELSTYAINRKYDTENPTGVRAVIGTSGRYYSKDACATVNVAKGVKDGNQDKAIRIIFDSGNYAMLGYVGSEAEFNSDDRGSLHIGEMKGSKSRIMMSLRLSGPNSSEIFVDEVVGLCNGENAGLTLNEISAIFKPQWEYQKISESSELITDESKISHFIKNSIESLKG